MQQGETAIERFACEYTSQPNEQVEKTDFSVASFVTGGFTIYLLENINNNSAAWITDHYECYISGPVGRNDLERIVRSAYETN